MNSSEVSVSFYGLLFWIFVIIKIGGTSLAAWSWFWILLPIVPVITLFLNKMGVMF